jgi:hypothetical protein
MTQGKLFKFLKSSSVLLLAALVFSCSEGGKQIHLIVPVGFRGAFLVQIDPQNGKDWGNSNDEWVVNVPAERVVKLNTDKPFLKWHATLVTYHDGKNLPYGGSLTTLRNQLQLWHLYTDNNTNYWFYVGTADESKALIQTHSASLTNWSQADTLERSRSERSQ